MAVKRPIISAARAADVFEEMVSVRRDYSNDNAFFRMDRFWQDTCFENGDWRINTYDGGSLEDYKRKAGVIAFGNKVTLTADARLMKRASEGCRLSNFILAHEAAHLGLDHHAKQAVTKNFQLFSDAQGMSNKPPTDEELEANYGAVFLQCGVALLDTRWDAMELARRAFSDIDYVRKAQRVVKVDAFLERLYRPRPRLQRVVL